ncbi:MAG: mycothiol system anti-sigma-R factor [Acidimicrobiales bacterium]
MSDHCREAVELLYQYMDGELTESHRILIRHHLDDCPPCFEAFDFEVELRVVIAQRCRERVPPSLVARVAAALSVLEDQPPH